MVSYGGNFRHSNFDLSIAPAGDSRNEGGGYAQDEIFLGKYVRLLVGARVDKFDIIEDVQFSPRTTLMLKPSADQTVRVLVQPRVSRAVGDQQLSSTRRSSTSCRSVSDQSGALGARLQLPGSRRRQQRRPARRLVPPQDLSGAVAYRLRDRLHRRHQASARPSRRPSYINETKDDIFFTQVASYRANNPPPRLAAAADRPRAA